MFEVCLSAGEQLELEATPLYKNRVRGRVRVRGRLAQVSLLGANFANFRGFSAREAA
jgi:hypothetical protein